MLHIYCVFIMDIIVVEWKKCLFNHLIIPRGKKNFIHNSTKKNKKKKTFKRM